MSDELKWCPEHTGKGCRVCRWLSSRKCGCEPGHYCLRCNKAVMDHVFEKTKESMGRLGLDAK